jgi:hypothetical protein
MTENVLNSLELTKYDLILLPGFIQWDLSKIENKYIKYQVSLMKYMTD